MRYITLKTEELALELLYKNSIDNLVRKRSHYSRKLILPLILKKSQRTLKIKSRLGLCKLFKTDTFAMENLPFEKALLLTLVFILDGSFVVEKHH